MDFIKLNFENETNFKWQKNAWNV